MNRQAIGLGMVLIGMAVLLAGACIALYQYLSRPMLSDEAEDYLDDVWQERTRRDAY